jgi:GTP-binding protein HflX
MDEHLDELASLADTAGARVVARLSQRRAAPAPRSFIGEGKVEELRELAQSTEASLVVFDEELSPAQGKNLEAALEMRVMDRPELILDIFATRARSKEARMQVELAQLEYMLPRLARMWVHLSRIRGGIGLRGPGETQIETDRRMIRRKISTLKKKLEHEAQHRETMRHGRRGMLTAVLVGYTNAGKSSLLKALTGADAFIENRLFATLDTMVREMTLNGESQAVSRKPGGQGPSPVAAETPEPRASPPGSRLTAHSGHTAHRVRLIDTVGFIRKLPHNLVASFRATLEEVTRADVLLHVIDASHAEWEDQVGVVDLTVADLQTSNGDIRSPLTAHRSPAVIHVFNKMDLVTEPAAFRARASAQFERPVFISAEKSEVQELLSALGSISSRPSAGQERAPDTHNSER